MGFCLCLLSLVTLSFLPCFPVGVFSGSSQTLLHLPPTQAQLLSFLGFHHSRSQPAQAGCCWEQQSNPSSCSHPLPSSLHPPISLPSHASIFNPDQCLNSLHSVASCFCQEKQTVKLWLTPTSSGSPQPFLLWAAHPHLLEPYTFVTQKMAPAFSTGTLEQAHIAFVMERTGSLCWEEAQHNVHRLQRKG